MSCRRLRRELLWLVRFGELDAGSARHLDHLAGCRECRDEVGLDRALVRQLRTALAERIGDATPSPSAWEGVLARMAQPEAAAIRSWTARLASLLRAGSAVAGASLALVMALNLEMAPIGALPVPGGGDGESITASTPAGRGAGLRHWEGRAPAAGTGLVRSEQSTIVWLPTPHEQLPLERTSLASAADEAEARPPSEPVDDPAQGGPAIVLSLVPTDAAAMSGSREEANPDEQADDEPASPAVQPAGGPS